jgi:hypothetical protein
MEQLDVEWQQSAALNINNSSVPFIGLNKELERTQFISSSVTPITSHANQVKRF